VDDLIAKKGDEASSSQALSEENHAKLKETPSLLQKDVQDQVKDADLLREALALIDQDLPADIKASLEPISKLDDHFVAVEGPIRRTREGGSEWEPIKILLEVDGNSNKMNTASNTRLRLTTKVGQAHIATGVPLDQGTNTPPSDPRNAAEKPNLESTDPHQSDR
jgi:hypothetical protein